MNRPTRSPTQTTPPTQTTTNVFASTDGSADTQPVADANWNTLLDPPQSEDEIGRLSRYRILDVLGQGGMGVVFRAEDPVARRKIALKVMRPQLIDHAQSRQRFLREAQAMAAIQSEYVVPVYHVDEAVTEGGKRAFLAMPLLEGRTLADRLRDGPLSVSEAATIGSQMARGLAASHACEQIHRDVKPSNVWLEAGTGRVQLLDFGLAHCLDQNGEISTESGAILGTPKYMAPEQAAGSPPDPRADLYSLGVTLYEAITGQVAFDGPSVMSILQKVATYDPPPARSVNSEVPAELSDTIRRLMSKEPQLRPGSGDEVADLLSRWADGNNAVGKISAPVEQRGSRSVARLLPALLATAVFVMGIAVVVTFWPDRTAQEPAEPPNPTSTSPNKPSASQPAQQPGTPSLHGYIDLEVWPDKAAAQAGEAGRMLGAPDVLPLKAGNYIEAKVSMVSGPSYIYVVWLESDGDAVPIYPWINGEWDRLPEQHPRRSLKLPGPLMESPSGIETLVLLARDQPLTAGQGVEVSKLFTGLPVQSSLVDRHLRVWLENGRPAHDRGAMQIADANRGGAIIDDLQQRLRSDAFRELFSYSRTVSFSFQGGSAPHSSSP